MIEMPVRFPDEGDVIAEDAADFRAMSPFMRLKAIADTLSAGEMIIRMSPQSEYMRNRSVELEELEQQAIKEFIARHGG